MNYPTKGKAQFFKGPAQAQHIPKHPKRAKVSHKTKVGTIYPAPSEAYDFSVGEQFHAGASSWAFKMRWNLPGILARGAGRIAGQLFPIPQAPQLIAQLAVAQDSFGGFQAGYYNLEPLDTNPVPYNLSTSEVS